MLKISPARCFSLSPAISSQFTVEIALQPKIAKKFIKTHLLGIQGRLRSSMLTNLKSTSLVLVMICRNHFHTVRANYGKITSFNGVPHFDVILGVAVLIQCQGVTDGRTDRQTDASTMAKTREALHAVVRKNVWCVAAASKQKF